MIGEDESPEFREDSSFAAERERLRQMLAFPDPVQTTASLDSGSYRREEPEPVPADVEELFAEVPGDDLARRVDKLSARVATLTGLVENVFDRVSLLSMPAPLDDGSPAPLSLLGDDSGRRLEQLSANVSSLGALVESLFDRLGPRGEPAPLTADELADIAARMVRMIETRLQTHSERLEQVIAELTTRGNAIAMAEGGANLAAVNDRLAMIGRAVLELQQTVAGQVQAPLEVQARDVSPLEVSRRDMKPVDVQALEGQQTAIFSRLTADIEQIQQDMNRVDQTVIEMNESMTRLPEQVAMQQPVARLDASILQQLETRLEELGTQLAQKLDDELGSRMQRFEALSQAMMVLVGEPVDKLIEKVNALAREREPAIRASESIKAIEEAQVLIATTVSALRQDTLEREALLRHTLEKMERLTGGKSR
jgi:hypothetical protein